MSDREEKQVTDTHTQVSRTNNRCLCVDDTRLKWLNAMRHRQPEQSSIN